MSATGEGQGVMAAMTPPQMGNRDAADVVAEMGGEIEPRIALLLAKATFDFRRGPQVPRHAIRFLMGQGRENPLSRVHRVPAAIVGGIVALPPPPAKLSDRA